MSYGIFMIEETDKTLLFVPLRGLIMELKKGEKEIIMDLMNKPSFSFEKLLVLFPTIDQSQLLQVNLNDHVFGIDENEEYNFRPESLVLFTTFNCNLCCTYCYSKAGERKIDMDWQTAKTAIDFVIRNAKMKKCEEVNLEFHGGGEPTQNWLLFKKALIYFKEQSQFNGLLPKINLSTNGVLSQKQIEWIAEHISSLQISLDGTKEIQDYQRPMINGGSSFEIVCNTTRFLLEKKVEVIIRSTVTGLGIDKIPEIVKFLLSTFPGVKIHLEPVSECGRGLQTGQKFPSPELFIEGFKNAEKIADVFGSEISYSGSSSNLTGFRQSFCGVSVPNFIVTPAGVVTACHEVAEKTHSLAENFIYGYFDTQDEKFVFDYDKIKKLKNYASNVSPICTECLALYYCAGECLAKRMESNEKINPRCKINQELMRYYVLKKFFGKEVSK